MKRQKKKIYILRPQKCKIRIEQANIIKETSNHYTNIENLDLDLNTDTLKIGDIKIKTNNLTQQFAKGSFYNHRYLGFIIQFIKGHNWLLRHKRHYLQNTEMDQTCRLCKNRRYMGKTPYTYGQNAQI